MSPDIDALLKPALNQSANWEKKLAQNAWGADTYAPAQAIACRVSVKTRLILDADGEQAVSPCKLTTTAPVETGDRIEVNGRRYIVKSVSAPAKFGGAEHRRQVYL